jgi:hypothetical protein
MSVIRTTRHPLLAGKGHDARCDGAMLAEQTGQDRRQNGVDDSD